MLGGVSEIIEQQHNEYTFAQQFAFQQLIYFCKESKEAQSLREKHHQLLAVEAKQKQQERILFWEQAQYLISSFTAVLSLVLVGLSIGVFIGLNTPNGAACSEINLLCRWLRLREPKVIVYSNEPFISERMSEKSK